MLTIPFYQLIDETSDIWRLIDTNTFPHLYPQNLTNLTQDMVDNINEHFYYREIGFSSPTRFLRHFHRLIKERCYTWKKLIESESALRDDDMIFNYDLTEESEDNRTDTSQNTDMNVPRVETTNTSTETQITHDMDTPDGITSDIETYISTAGKVTDTNTSKTQQTGANTTVSNYAGDNNNTHELTRKGNIGVMTAAQILGGYREGQMWDAYNAVIFPEVEQLFLTIIDLDDVDLY